MEERIIQAVDIGTTKVAAIVAKQTSNDKLEILGVGISPSFGVIRADVTNISRTVDAIQKAVKDAEKQSGIPFTDVYVGIAGSHVNSLQHRAILMRPNYDDVISQRDIDKLKEDTLRLPLPPGDMIIEILPQDYKVDHNVNIQDPIGMPGNKIEANIHVITGSKIAVNNIRRCIIEAGLNVKEVIMQPIASAAAVLCEEEMQSGVALVDIGGGTTDIAIFVDGVIGHTAVIPFGGEIITEDIKQGCKILKQTAESIKVQHGCTFASESHDNVVITIPGLKDRAAKEISMKMLVGIIQARMEEILESVIHEINISGLADKLTCGIVLTGGGSQLKHLRQLTEYLSGYDIKIGLPNEHLSKTRVSNVDNPIYSTAIGLIIKGLERDISHKTEIQQVKKHVDKSTNVEKTEAIRTENPVFLENVSPVEAPAQPAEVKKPENVKSDKISDIFRRAGKKFTQWIGDDELPDFNDTNNKR